MEVDIKRLAQVLNDTADKIKETSEVVQKNPVEAMSFIPVVMNQMRELQAYANLGDITASIKSEIDKDSVKAAIGSFLQNTKDAQEKAGVMGAAFFSNPQFQALRDNLEQVKASLEKGKRVEKPEKGQEL